MRPPTTHPLPSPGKFDFDDNGPRVDASVGQTGIADSFDLDETLSWLKALPRMEAHILDGPHFLLETHPTECAGLMGAFVRRVEKR